MYPLVLLFVTLNAVAEASIYVNVSGDIVLGALFPVHRQGINGQNCGQIQVSYIIILKTAYSLNKYYVKKFYFYAMERYTKII